MTNCFPKPGPWCPFCGFKIPVQLSDLSEEQQGAIKCFLHQLSVKLNNMSFQCKFDFEGNLLTRKRNGDPDAASVGLSPSEVYRIICKSFVALRLQPNPPVFRSFQSKPHMRRVATCPTSGNLEYEHIVSQFEHLMQWCSERWNDGTFLSAIQAIF